MGVMSIDNPTDEALASAAAGGDRSSLEELVRRCMPWVHNLAWRLIGDATEAEDVAQEAMIKVVTRLASFRGQSRFRTWLYTIVRRHVLDLARRPAENVFSSFDIHASILDSAPDLPDPRAVPAEKAVIIKEARTMCLEGMLLCLDREQRFSFIAGGLFGLPSDELGTVLGITAEAARQRLSRARQDLKSYMKGRCGYFDPPGPCRCARKAAAAVKAGYIDPERLVFTAAYKTSIRAQLSRTGLESDELLAREGIGVFLDEPFLECPPPLIASLFDRLNEPRPG